MATFAKAAGMSSTSFLSCRGLRRALEDLEAFRPCPDEKSSWTSASAGQSFRAVESGCGGSLSRHAHRGDRLVDSSASAKFKDTLTGRKRDIWLTPLTSRGSRARIRQARTGSPLSTGWSPGFPCRARFRSGISSRRTYWSRKDIQELFSSASGPFQRFLEPNHVTERRNLRGHPLRTPCEIAARRYRTIWPCWRQLHVAHVIRPYSSHRPTEIVSAPGVYSFDTGFVCHYKGWHPLRAPEDRGALWEHYVLNESRPACRRGRYATGGISGDTRSVHHQRRKTPDGDRVQVAGRRRRYFRDGGVREAVSGSRAMRGCTESRAIPHPASRRRSPIRPSTIWSGGWRGRPARIR